MGLGVGAGWWVDQRWGTNPWGTLVGLMLGLTAAGRELYLIAKNTRFGTTSSPPPTESPGDSTGGLDDRHE